MNQGLAIAGLMGLCAAGGVGLLSDRALAEPPKPTFEALDRDAQAFAKAAEAYCGFGPGSALLVPNGATVVVRLASPPDHFQRFQCLMETLNSAELEKHGVRVLLMGRQTR